MNGSKTSLTNTHKRQTMNKQKKTRNESNKRTNYHSCFLYLYLCMICLLPLHTHPLLPISFLALFLPPRGPFPPSFLSSPRLPSCSMSDEGHGRSWWSVSLMLGSRGRGKGPGLASDLLSCGESYTVGTKREIER